MKHHYSPDEVNAILERALAGKPLPGDMTRDQLVQLAAEVGVTPEELDYAEAQIRSAPDSNRQGSGMEVHTARGRAPFMVFPLAALAAALLALLIASSGSASGIMIIAFLLLSFAISFAVRSVSASSPRRRR